MPEELSSYFDARRLHKADQCAQKRGLTAGEYLLKLHEEAEQAWHAQRPKQPCVVLPFRPRSK